MKNASKSSISNKKNSNKIIFSKKRAHRYQAPGHDEDMAPPQTQTLAYNKPPKHDPGSTTWIYSSADNNYTAKIHTVTDFVD